MFAHIHTPLLRFTCMHSGFCGIQLTPFGWQNPASIILLLWNILYNISTFWGVATLKLINADSVIAGCTPNSRTLFGFLIHHSQKLSSYTQLIIVSYFLVYGRQLVATLDNRHFQLVYQSRRKGLVIFWVNFALNHLSMGAFLSQAIRIKDWQERNWWERLCSLTGYYTMFAYTYWLYNVIHYCQCAFNAYLIHLEKSFLNRKLSFHRTLAQLQSLALISRKINTLLSFPFLLYITMTVYSIVLSASTSIICIPRLPIILFTSATVSYLAFLILLNQKNGQTVSRLFSHLHRRIDVKEADLLHQLANKSLADLRKHHQLKRKFLSRQRCVRCHLQGRFQSVSSRRVKLTECEKLYTAYLDIRIFQMSILNSRTLWQAALFVLLYVILFSQTVNEMN